MNRLQSIQHLRDSHAHSAVDSAIESISDWVSHWGAALEPEERDHAAMILERLLDLQANAVRSATRRGEVMSLRLEDEAKEQGRAVPVEIAA